MGLLDQAFKLPMTNSEQSASALLTGNAFGPEMGFNDATLGESAKSFKVTGTDTKIQESVSTMYDTFGSSEPFSKLGATMPSFEKLQADAMLTGNAFGSDLGFDSPGFGEATPSATPSASSAKAGVQNVSTDHFVSLKQLGGASDAVVQFDVLPEIVEAHAVQYEVVQPPQFPGAFQKYKGTDSTQWTLNVTFIARTTEEATNRLHDLHRLRGWTMPYYGSYIDVSYPGKLGAPPPVLELRGMRNLIGPVPVVITSLNWNWPKDVDYLPTTEPGPDGNPVPFPVILQIAIQLIECYSTTQFNQFNLAAYYRGDLNTAFNTVPVIEAGQGRGTIVEQPGERAAYMERAAATSSVEAADAARETARFASQASQSNTQAASGGFPNLGTMIKNPIGTPSIYASKEEWSRFRNQTAAERQVPEAKVTETHITKRMGQTTSASGTANGNTMSGKEIKEFNDRINKELGPPARFGSKTGPWSVSQDKINKSGV